MRTNTHQSLEEETLAAASIATQQAAVIHTAIKPPPTYLLRSYRGSLPTERAILQCLFSRLVWRTIPRPVIYRRFIRWLTRFPGQLTRSLRQHGPAAKKAHGRSLLRQALDMVQLANRSNITPVEYYGFQICRHRDEFERRRYLSFHVFKSIVDTLEAAQPGRRPDDFDDKRGFELHCHRYGIPCAETVAIVSPDAITDLAGHTYDGEVPLTDLFVKLRFGLQGIGAVRFDLADANTFSDQNGHSVPGIKLFDHLRTLSGQLGDDLMVQTVLRNSNALSALAGRTLATVRIVTLEDETGAPEVIIARLRTTGDVNAVVDNFSSGGIAFPIDIDTGELGVGRRSSDTESYHRHPITGQQIKGQILPSWPAVRALALKMHRSYRGAFLCGIDVAITPDGPVAVEINGGSCMAVAQLDSGLIGTRFSQLMAHHARCLLETTESDNSAWRIGADL